MEAVSQGHPPVFQMKVSLSGLSRLTHPSPGNREIKRAYEQD